MLSFLRKRINPETVYAGGLQQRIITAAFPVGAPQLPVVVPGPPYQYHEGDLFTPGAENFVLEPLFELPVIAFWGSGFQNTQPPSPIQPPPYQAYPNLVVTGLGGQIPGQIATQGLIDQGNIF